jgi:hypothetical protein
VRARTRTAKASGPEILRGAASHICKWMRRPKQPALRPSSASGAPEPASEEVVEMAYVASLDADAAKVLAAEGARARGGPWEPVGAGGG